MPRAGLALCLAALLASPASAAGPPPPEQWIVVVAPAFRAAVAPLVSHRKAQGMRVRVLEPGESGKLRDRLRKLCREHYGASYILLVGAISQPVFLANAATGVLANAATVPPLTGTAGRMKSEPTDAGYGCPDGKRLPTVSVGRLPARTEAECRGMVRKILALERDTRPGDWRRRLTILAGIPAYNPVVDRLVENLALGRFARIHPAWTGRAVYTNPLSRFCLPDAQLRKQTIDYLGEGQAFILYLGHSNAEGLYGGPAAAFLDRSDWGRLAISTGAGVFVTFGCNGCQLKGRDGEGYGVSAIRNPRGPAAVLGSHGICFAAMVQLAADGLFHRAFQGPVPRRLGACWLAMLEGVAAGKIDFLSYRMLDAVDGDSRIPQAIQREEHLEMFVLLGDPALRLPELAGNICLLRSTGGPPVSSRSTGGSPVSSRSTGGPPVTPTQAGRLCYEITPGKAFVVRGRLPERLSGAKVRIALERPAASEPVGLQALPKLPGPRRDRVMLDNHYLANRFAVVEKELKAKGIEFSATLEVPDPLPWPELLLRVYACTKTEEGMAVERLRVIRP
jgi:hypothetical protein